MTGARSEIEHTKQIVHRDAVVGRDLLENARKRADFDRVVIRDYFMVLAVPLRRQSNVRPMLAGGLVSERA